ncbi:ATP-binding protein [Pseudoalteromonas fenneropenaei]|uniref:histidine kinase n=1 Tax=Pseudoalteromonas fenneropenaei TaxID=1737459 RepID=A0ABV7CQ64_9GAMM
MVQQSYVVAARGQTFVQWLLQLLLLLVCLSVVYVAGLQQDRAYRYEQVKSQGQQLFAYFDSEFARFAAIPKLVSENPALKAAFLSAQAQSTAYTDLNIYLQDVQRASGASDVYLLDAKGDVIASSNWSKDYSYIGNNFAFRRYFIDAIGHGSALEFAVGIRSKARGFYFSHVVSERNHKVGVVVLKVNVSKFEQDREKLNTGYDNEFAVLGDDGLIYGASQPEWPLQHYRSAVAEASDWQWQAQQVNIAHQAYYFTTHPLPELAAQLVFLSNVSDLPYQQWPRIGIACLLLVILRVVWHVVQKRWQGYQALQSRRQALEDKVEERTQALEKAQNALIRAAKLATIGQLSASINHEINQPLSAINTYLASCRRLLRKGQFSAVSDNLDIIESLVFRVHQIVAQLKQFSQSGDNKMRLVALRPLIDNALMITGPELKQAGVEVEVSVPETEVWVEPFRFEQVLVNLFTNAAQAMAEQSEKRLTIGAELFDEKVKVTVADTGVGISQHLLGSIFEPFVTTKTGHGLGLGLSISKEIVASFGGNLSAHNRPTQGAEFIIALSGKMHSSEES